MEKMRYLVTIATDEGDITKVRQFFVYCKSDKKLIKSLWKECDNDNQFSSAKQWFEDHNDEYQENALISIINWTTGEIVYDLNNLKFELEVTKQNEIEPA